MLFSYNPARQPFQRFHLHLCPAQFAEGFLRCVHFQMSIRSAESCFQLSEILCFEQMIHLLAHGVAQVGPVRKCPPRRRDIAAADGGDRCVQIIRNGIGKFLYLKAAVKRNTEQGSDNDDTGVDPFHDASFLPPARRFSFFSRK